MKYEYRIAQSDGLLSQSQCNELGAEGWELVTIILSPDGKFYHYFKRPVIDG